MRADLWRARWTSTSITSTMIQWRRLTSCATTLSPSSLPRQSSSTTRSLFLSSAWHPEVIHGGTLSYEKTWVQSTVTRVQWDSSTPTPDQSAGPDLILQQSQEVYRVSHDGFLAKATDCHVDHHVDGALSPRDNEIRSKAQVS